MLYKFIQSQIYILKINLIICHFYVITITLTISLSRYKISHWFCHFLIIHPRKIILATFLLWNFSFFNSHILPSNNISPYDMPFTKRARNVQCKLSVSWARLSLKLNLEELLYHYMSAIEITMRWKSILIIFLLFSY